METEPQTGLLHGSKVRPGDRDKDRLETSYNVHSRGPSTQGTAPRPIQEAGPETEPETDLHITQLGQGLKSLMGLVRAINAHCTELRGSHGAGSCVHLTTATSTARDEQSALQVKTYCLLTEIYKINIVILHCGFQILQRHGEVGEKIIGWDFCKLRPSHNSENFDY